MYQHIFLGTYILSFVCFSWAALNLFKVENDGSKKGKQIISVLGLMSFLFYLFSIITIEIPVQRIQFSLIVLLNSFFVFWWAVKHTQEKPLDFAFSKENPTYIVSSGPYKYARHPFYLSYILFWLASSIAIFNLTALIPLITLTSIYIFCARDEESKFLASQLNDNYLNYKKKTKMFVPYIF